MKWLIPVLLTCLCLISCLESDVGNSSEELSNFTDSLFNASLDSGFIAGGSILVHQADMTLVDKAYGKASIELGVPTPEDAIYEIYFPICALVALQLQAGLDGFLAIEKYVLKKRGLFTTDRRRRPYSWELDAETEAELERLLRRLDDVLR